LDQHNDSNKNSAGTRVLAALKAGSVTITGEKGEGQKGALIRTGKGVTLFVNGKQVSEKIEVFPEDQVEFKLDEEVTPDKLDIKISADGLKAEACYFTGQKVSYELSDHPYTDDLIVEGVRREEPLTTLNSDDIKKRLAESQVQYGYDNQTIERLVEDPGQWHLVAVGLPAEQGKNGFVEPQFAGSKKSVTYDDMENAVDFRKRFEIEQVESGDVIALIHPPIPGKPGKKVTGEDINPDPVSRVEVNCESGTELNPENDKILATTLGIPTYKKGKMHSFRVDNLYTHKGDVDIKSGNIHFRGHFKVEGGVTEGMKVAADGNVEIGDNVSGAEILAGGSILLKANCIKCKVEAGWVNIFLNKVYKTLQDMLGSLENAVEASKEVVQVLEQKGKYSPQMETAVVRALLQSKFSVLPEYAAQLQKYLKEAGKSMPENIVKTIIDITPHFIDFQYSSNLNSQVLSEIESKVSTVLENYEPGVDKADITAPYVQNSLLTCTGDINIPGAGVYNSHLKCSGDVKVSRLFRGGVIESGGDVYIGEAGAQRITAEQGLISVPYKGRVFLGVAYENVRVKFGTTEYRLDQNHTNIRLILDQQEFEVRILHWEK
jgi:uncharacterized protein